MESDSNKNDVNKIDENIPTSQPSAALALTALLDNTSKLNAVDNGYCLIL